jgi:antitoxin component YwqK of YwqJK toxin-antitoxin module
MKKQVVLVIFLFACVHAIACVCAPKGELTVAELGKYTSIALVKVVAILENVPRDTTQSRTNFPAFTIKVQTLEWYKGDTLSEVYVNGGHKKFNTWTSCDLGIQEGDEWLFFIQYSVDGKPSVSYCERQVQYRSANGWRDWQYKRGFKELFFLDKAFSKDRKNSFKGQQIELYSDGKKEVESFYKNGKLNGKRTYWYPNGNLRGEEFYVKGKLHGSIKWYYRDGLIDVISNYHHGKQRDTTIYFGSDYTDSNKIKPLYWRLYDKKGRLIHSKTYHFDVKLFDFMKKEKYYLKSEVIYDWKKNLVTNTGFHSNGNLSDKYFHRATDYKSIGTSYRWNEKGDLMRTWEYDEQGKLIRTVPFNEK